MSVPRSLAEIEKDEIVIRIPIDALEFAAPLAWERRFGQQSEHWKVKDKAAFAKEMVRMLNREVNDAGDSIVDGTFDKAACDCIELGCGEGVEF